jgi:hypothetical protein
MADLTITPADVTPNTATSGYTPVKATGVAGETITAGQSVYLNSTDNKIYKADANDTAAKAAAIGVALHGATANQPITYQTSGALNFGTILAAGKYYVVSATPGGIAPVADLTTGWYSTQVVWAYSTSVGVVDPLSTGIQVA